MVDEETLEHIRRQIAAMYPHDLKKLLPGRKRANAQLREHLADIQDQLAKGEAIVQVIEELLNVDSQAG